jgi:hypothetical protein
MCGVLGLRQTLLKCDIKPDKASFKSLGLSHLITFKGVKVTKRGSLLLCGRFASHSNVILKPEIVLDRNRD